jgi:transposase-like protein
MMKCPFCCSSNTSLSGKIKKGGRYKRKSDSKYIQRYFCSNCNKSYSPATVSELNGQNKRRVNKEILKLSCSGVSQRRIARNLNIHRITVARKFRFLADQIKQNPRVIENVEEIQFDHMETIEHTKLKPVAILVVVDKKTRKILSLQASSMPSKGLLVEKSIQKYGKRKDGRAIGMKEVFLEISQTYTNITKIESDESPHYPNLVNKYFKGLTYKQHKGRRGCVTGQGELKAGGRDPLFSLNHTCAMLRANINRLFRRTWCTTKLISELQRHLDLYAYYHNKYLTA